MKEIAFRTIILYLVDNVLRQVNDAKTAIEVWTQLDTIYLTNNLYIKERFLGFKMNLTKELETNIDEFNRMLLDLSNMKETMFEENRAIILLNSLSGSYNEIKK